MLTSTFDVPTQEDFAYLCMQLKTRDGMLQFMRNFQPVIEVARSGNMTFYSLELPKYSGDGVLFVITNTETYLHVLVSVTNVGKDIYKTTFEQSHLFTETSLGLSPNTLKQYDAMGYSAMDVLTGNVPSPTSCECYGITDFTY